MINEMFALPPKLPAKETKKKIKIEAIENIKKEDNDGREDSDRLRNIENAGEVTKTYTKNKKEKVDEGETGENIDIKA